MSIDVDDLIDAAQDPLLDSTTSPETVAELTVARGLVEDRCEVEGTQPSTWTSGEPVP